MEDPNDKVNRTRQVLRRYKTKTYKPYTVNLRKVDDADCINFLEEQKKLGLSPTEVFRKLVRGEYK